MIAYRLLSPDEYPAAVLLWTEVFGVEAPFFQSLLDGGDADDFSVGAFDGERIVSSVHVFMRWFRDRKGRPQRVGGIGSVSTLPDYRKQGHSSELLARAIEEMAARGCVWSYLGTGVNHHYARQGWRTVSTPYFVGNARPAQGGLQAAQVTDELLTEMAQVHSDYSQNRPMANDRSPAQLQHAVRYRITRPGDEVFVSYSGSNLVAYLVCSRESRGIELVEAACQTGFEADLQALVRDRIAVTTGQVISSLPEDSPGHMAFKEACSQIIPSEECSWMVRPIADRISLPDLVAIHADLRGRRSNLDNF